MVREVSQPAADQALRHRLRTDVHESPLGELIIGKLQFPAVQGREDILCPWNQEPDNGTFFFGYGFQNGFRCGAFQKNGFAAGKQTAEPVHFRTGVIQRRDAEEYIVFGLAVVLLLDAAGMHQTFMVM